MDDFVDIGEYKICVAYDGLYYVYYRGGMTITSSGLSLVDALIFVGAHMKSLTEQTAISFAWRGVIMWKVIVRKDDFVLVEGEPGFFAFGHEKNMLDKVWGFPVEQCGSAEELI